jgi:hypothetical protein
MFAIIGYWDLFEYIGNTNFISGGVEGRELLML